MNNNHDPRQPATATPIALTDAALGTRRGQAAVALISAALIAYELVVMRLFANGGWAHFGSTVISIAMFGFGAFSTLLCITRPLFRNRPLFWLNGAMVLLGPAMIAVNAVAQRLPFNPMFLISDAQQKVYLLEQFLLYFLPFFLGAMVIGLVFLAGQSAFGRIYFANMAGSGCGGLVLFIGLYWLHPERLLLVPLLLWLLGTACWFSLQRNKFLRAGLAASMGLALCLMALLPQLVVSPYKGVSYARNFPDAQCVYSNASPFGLTEVFRSTYFHFAPGLSDAASLYLDTMPAHAFLSMYIDGDGPIGVMRHLAPHETGYMKFLPMAMPYLLASAPEVFVLQFGGGISTNVALELQARTVTVAEGNPAVVAAIRDDAYLASFTGHVLKDPRVRLIESDGRIAVAQQRAAYDIIDLSLADSTGLSMPGGGSIHENYNYTVETFRACLAALRPDGLLSVTVWNKEDPPKSTLKLLSTLTLAARGDVAATGPTPPLGERFFICHTYLSTLTVLYKRSGFTPSEYARLHKHCRKMSFALIHPVAAPVPAPGAPNDQVASGATPSAGLTGSSTTQPAATGPRSAPVTAQTEDHAALARHASQLFSAGRNVFFEPGKTETADKDVDLTADNIYRTAARLLLSGQESILAREYVFNTDPLTNDRPYFAGFVRMGDWPRFFRDSKGELSTEKLEMVSDQWGYLLLWMTLAISVVLGLLLMLVPLLFAPEFVTRSSGGRLGVVGYFFCLGIGYIVVEIALIGKFVLCLGNPTVSVTVLITGMLLFSGIGSYLSSRCVQQAQYYVIRFGLGIGAMLLVYAFGLDLFLNAIGMWPYPVRIVCCLLSLLPLALLMGFPFALGMATLSRLGHEHFFVWAWGINGSFSVAGSVLVPILAVQTGLSTVLCCTAVVYLLAVPAFIAMQQADRSPGPPPESGASA